MDIKSNKKGTFSVIGGLSFIFICGFLIFTLVLNNDIKTLDSQRNTYLDGRERAREWVTQEIINYISVVNEETWKIYKSSSNLDEYARNQLYGSNFSSFELPGISQYMVLDSQYTLGEENYEMYINMILNFDGENRETVFLVSIDSNNQITNVVVY